MKKVIKLSLENKIIKEYNSIKEASIDNNINAGNIGNCANKKRETAGKYKWKFKEELIYG